MTCTRPMSALLMAIFSLTAWLLPAEADRAQQFAEADIFLELNHTDGDLGLHGSIDADSWTSLEIEGPAGVGKLLRIAARGALRRHGMTQIDFESAEPSFDELSPETFFRRFPEGHYSMEAFAHDGGEFKGTARLSHVLAAPPANIFLSDVPAAESCEQPPPVVLAPVSIRWDPVTTSHPEIGRSGPVDVALYQVFVEAPGVTWGVDLPPTVTAIDVPAGVTALGTTFKFEVIVRTSSGNNTAVESCFEVR